MEDERYQFLANNIIAASQGEDTSKIISLCSKSKDVIEFLDDPNSMILKVIALKDGNIDFTRNVTSSISYDETSLTVLFIKRNTMSISPSNISSTLEVQTLHGSPLTGIYNSLRNVWCPSLLNSEWTQKLSPKIPQLLAELESSLSVSVKSPDSFIDIRNVNDIDNVSEIFEPSDEIKFWSDLKDSRKSKFRNIAKKIDSCLVDVTSPGFYDVDSLTFEAFNELIVNTFDVLNGIWLLPDEFDGQVYPQERMEHFFDCIGSSIVRYIQKQFQSINVWKDNLSDIKMSLTTAILLCEQWVDIPRKLTHTFWLNNRVHPWKGKQHEDGFVVAFKARLEHVLKLRVLSDELSQLITTEEKQSFRLDSLFNVLEETKPLLYNPYTEPIWKKAVSVYEKSIDPIESAVANHFRSNINALMDRPQTLLREFQKYSSLLDRPNIRRELSSERETLLTLLKEVVKKLETAVDRLEQGRDGKLTHDMGDEKRISSIQDTGRTNLLSPRVSGVVHLRQIGSKVVTIAATSKSILQDLSEYSKFASACESLLVRIKNEEDNRFESWVNDIRTKIVEEDASFKLSGSLMAWRDGMLTVNFPEELVRFLREIRQLDELGFDIPKSPIVTSTASKTSRSKSSGSTGRTSIVDKATEAEKYYRYGILLKKTANFYNSLSEQMIDVQEELLLDSLSAFGNIAAKPSLTVSAGKSNSSNEDDITWSNPSECEKYIRVVQEAADKLSAENRWLRKIHETLGNQTVSLMNIDLLKQTDIWKLKWKDIKEKVTVVRSKYSEKDSKRWILHWDHQICKALEISYQFGLESLNENLSEIKAELVFNLSTKRLELKPPMEQIRQSYYNEMKKFVTIPNNFEGLSSSSGTSSVNIVIYRKICSRNAKRLQRVYHKAEALFHRLAELLFKYSTWVKLAQVTDLDQFIETNVLTPEDFTLNFKSLKSKKKDIDKLLDQEKVDCCTISLIPMKVFLDDFLQQVQDTLLLTLRRQLLNEFKEVDFYLDSSSDRLSTRPKSVDEISLAKKQWKEIDSKKLEMKELSKKCTDKKKLLLQYAPGTAVDVSEVISRMSNLEGEGSRWDDYDVALEAFNDMIEEQKGELKVLLEDEVMALNEGIDKFGSRWKQLKPGRDDNIKFTSKSEIQQIFDNLDDWKSQFTELVDKSSRLVESCLNFGLNKPKFAGLDALVDDLNNTTKSWDLLKGYSTELEEYSTQDWITFSTNVYVLQDLALKWLDTIKKMTTTNINSGNAISFDNVTDYIYTSCEKMKKAIPSLKYCQGQPFKEDHWMELLQGKLNLPKDVTFKNVKLEHFLSRLDILIDPQTLTFVKNLQSQALGEVQIREALQELRTWEKTYEIRLLSPVESGRKLPLVRDWKDLFVDIGDKQSLLSSLKESQFFKPFADQGNALDLKITQLDGLLHTLNVIQRKWVYLEPIFSRGALPSEEIRFKRIDEDLYDIMTSVNADPKLFSLLEISSLEDKLNTMQDQLERCQKALTEFLEVKRSAMPRFYFIGDDDLLEILGQAKNPAVIQSHLKKLFQGINKVEFNANHTQIVSMVSSMNETVSLESPVNINERVEDWLHELAKEMRSTLASLLIKCLKSLSSKGVNIKKSVGELGYWDYPSQILCLAQSIKFTEDMEVAIEEGHNAVENLNLSLQETLTTLTSHDLSNEPLMQIKMKSLVFDLVHQIDVIKQVKEHGVSKTSDWFWRKQLRYYLNKSSTAEVKMHDASFEYTYEYQGNAPRLVHTPLTDKCYLTLTQGMKMGFGGNPYGPAGTGKTESVKALAQCLGRQVLVFNCDEALESTSMVRIFIGIVKCGAFGCFDEFNRLKEDQLSAISQQIQIIQDAIKNKVSRITLLGQAVDVDFNSGIFVTLNPAGKGYGGRSRLPDNLKALFRPVAMGAPDNVMIAQVSLVTEGFTQSVDLASKIVSLFKLSLQLLSYQLHYDWGLRALKAVLNSGGRLIQWYKAQGTLITKEMEFEILIKAIRVNTLSKLTYSDTNKFLALIGDVFPGVNSSDISGGELEEAIKLVMKEKPFHLVEDPAQIKKMIQLKESLDQRMGVVIVGPSGSGKSSLWRVLKSALIKCGQPVVTYVMNPKSMPRERLLGHMDIDTREWFDGILTDAARKVVREPSDVRCWIICDGDVDPEWIESLNSVLDDNHLLTLPNGERINFGSNVNFLFETHDLRFASPATISRMGMIFLSDEDLEIKRLIQRWLSTFPQERLLLMATWLDELFYRTLEAVIRLDSSVIETTLVGIVMNGLSQVKDATTRQEFTCGLIRGLGGNLPLTVRSTLAKDVFLWANERPPDLGNPLNCYASGNNFLSFTASNGLGNGSKGIDTLDLRDIGTKAVIPTVSVLRSLATLDIWINNMEPFILVGPEGCGKSLIINHAIKTYSSRNKRHISIATLHCNAQTSADDVIGKIVQTCVLFSTSNTAAGSETVSSRVYRPRDCDRLILYLKDINLPKPDQYDTCQLIAFLQQIITFDGFYDENLEFLKLDRIQIVASINAATTVGRHILSSRFTAITRILVVDYPDIQELTLVYQSFLRHTLTYTDLAANAVGDHADKLSTLLVDIYSSVRDKFTVDDQRHYLFTPRDITTWVKQLCRYDAVSNLNELLNVVAHEAFRVFRDRLVGMDAVHKFESIVSGALRAAFRFNLAKQDAIYYSSFTNTSRTNNAGSSTGSGNSITKLYFQKEEDFKKSIQQGLLYYEREEKDLNMLLYPEIMEHIAHIDRILSTSHSTSGSHLLLVGKCGVGRRPSVTLASYMLGYQLFTPMIGREYRMKQFIADLKTVLNVGGIKGEHVVLLIEDFQLVSESMLEMINSLISSGEIPIYTHDELEPMLTPLKELLLQSKDDFDSSSVPTPYEYFISRVRKHVHVVVSMDPQHASFLYRCESNPALYAQCQILWFGEFRRPTLQLIPKLIDGIATLITSSDMSEAYDEDFNESKQESKQESKSDKLRSTSSSALTLGFKSDVFIDLIIAIHSSCCIIISSNDDNADRTGIKSIQTMASTLINASPRDYLIFLQSWYNLFTFKRSQVVEELMHLNAGLSKLESAAAIVNDLKTNAVHQERDLKAAQEAADHAMEEISKALNNATERRHEVNEIKRVVAENEVKTQQRKSDIERELADIRPILEQAQHAVGSIKSEHLNEIRSLPTPPEAIVDVLAAVLTLLGVQDTSWLSMKKFLSNRGVKEDILNFDAKKMSNELRKNVAKHIKKHASSFEDSTIARASAAAAPMATWVKANIRYSLVIEKIQPLQLELEEEIQKLEQSQSRLKRCETELTEIDTRVSQLKQEFGVKTAETERLKRNLLLASTTLDKAERLINQLSGEQTRWKNQVKQLNADLTKLPLKMLLAAGFSTYLVKTPEDIREFMIKAWQDIISASVGGSIGTSADLFSFKRMMSSESELLQWKAMGLPSDDLSQENALVIAQYHRQTMSRIPFIIDPAAVATDWLKQYLLTSGSQSKSTSGGASKYSSSGGQSPLEVINFHDSRFANSVELAVRFGKTLVILEVDTIEPMLYPLIRRDLYTRGPRYVVTIGDKEVDYNENFRLYLITRNPVPNLLPDILSMVTIVNFTVTKSGLEGQLLGIAIQFEQPEIEVAKGEMLAREEEYKLQLVQLEKDLLQSLATTEGNLLENTALIESLSLTKEKSAEIEASLLKSAEVSEQLDTQRNVYRPFALAGSRLYFLVKALQVVNSMYQFSLVAFLALFKQALTAQHDPTKAVGNLRPDVIEDRLKSLCGDVEVRVLFFISRALFKEHRLMFALHLIRGMHPDLFQKQEWEVFTGAVVASVASHTDGGIVKGYPSWAALDRQDAYRVLTEYLPLLANQLDLANAGKWSRFSTSLEAERDLPTLKGVTLFQKVLLIQVFRPDRLVSALNQFCTDALRIQSLSGNIESSEPASPGKGSSSSDQQSSSLIKQLYESSSSTMPILVISLPGSSDPSKEISEYAIKMVGASAYEELALGGGKQDVAVALLRKAAAQGTWVCLKNLHLVTHWLPVLEKEVTAFLTASTDTNSHASITASVGYSRSSQQSNILSVHPDFRLWLTSEQHSRFPPILLQMSLKATYESPPGIKKNLQGTIATWDDSIPSNDPVSPVAKSKASSTSTQDEMKMKLFFVLAVFHAVLQERRNFIPQGFTKFYEFSYGDLRAGSYVMEASIQAAISKPDGDLANRLDWEAIHGLMEDAIYGGRIDNLYDVRVLRAYLKLLFTPRLVNDRGSGQEIIAGTPLRMPASPDFHSFRKIITQLPDIDAPYFFALPDNVERSLQRTTSTAVIKQLRMLSAIDSQGGKFDRDKWRAQLSPILDLWQQLTTSSPGLLATKRSIGSSATASPAARNAVTSSPIDDFVGMEFELAGELCNMIDLSMQALKKVLFGSGLLTPTIQAIASSLISGFVPSEWLRRWDRGPEKPQSWLREIIKKRIALTKWKTLCSGQGSSSPVPRLLSEPLSLGDLFNPATFVNALRQQTARKLNLAIDRVVMISTWSTLTSVSAASGGNEVMTALHQECPLPCTLTNMLLQGASFSVVNAGSNTSVLLQEPSPDGSEIIPAPLIHFGFIPIPEVNDEKKGPKSPAGVEIPVYLNPSREDFLLEFLIPYGNKNNEDKEKWILAGVALFLSEAE